MKFRKDLRIAVRLMEALTMEPRPLASYAGQIGTTVNFLEQIARKLRRDGLLKVRRGPGGGVFRSKDTVTFARVAVALGQTKMIPEGEVKDTVDRVNNMLLKHLDEVSLVGTLERGEE